MVFTIKFCHFYNEGPHWIHKQWNYAFYFYIKKTTWILFGGGGSTLKVCNSLRCNFFTDPIREISSLFGISTLKVWSVPRGPTLEVCGFFRVPTLEVHHSLWSPWGRSVVTSYGSHVTFFRKDSFQPKPWWLPYKQDLQELGMCVCSYGPDNSFLLRIRQYSNITALNWFLETLAVHYLLLYHLNNIIYTCVCVCVCITFLCILMYLIYSYFYVYYGTVRVCHCQ